MSTDGALARTKQVAKATPAYPAYVWVRDGARELAWRLRGRPHPPPASFKRRLLRQTGRRFALRYFVETGTFMGDTVAALRPQFEHLYTIELFEPLYLGAVSRFADEPAVTVLQGDSASRLPEVLDRLSGPALLWLDAHDSGPGTGAAGVDPPAAELAAIFARDTPHVVYLDDACTFKGVDGYPTVEQIQEMVEQARPGWRCYVADDIVRIEPPVTQAS